LKKRFIAIGDIHGRDAWKKIDADLYERIIFVGDYVDGYLSDEVVIQNLKDIIEFKKRFGDKVILLLGNHDIQYFLWHPNHPFGCSGYRAEIQPILTSIFHENHECFQAAYQIDNFLFTHAGVTNGWYEYCRGVIDEYAEKFETATLADTLNVIFRSKDTNILHFVSKHRGGYYTFGGITWADKRETMNDPLVGYHQIVGHTRVSKIDTFVKNESTKITYIDVLSTIEDFYTYPVTFE
jgi:hypothetical protein